MTSRYRVEYALKSHRRDEFIEWIKGLLAVPFVLRADAENYDNQFDHYDDPESYENYAISQEGQIALECQKGYLSVLRDIERLIEHTILIDNENDKRQFGSSPIVDSRLRKLVPTVGRFHTYLPLCEAFLIEDSKRLISQRRLVSPSFNDIRMMLNTAQILSLSTIFKDPHNDQRLKLITFDGDVTLYNDGSSLTEDSPVINRLLSLLKMDFFIGVVTAAGYPGQSGADRYYERLKGLIDIIRITDELTDAQKCNLLIMGGESNYLFRYDTSIHNFKFLEGDEWYLPMMKNWDKKRIEHIMDSTEDHMKRLQSKLRLQDKSDIVKKERSIGIVPKPGHKIIRENLEELVLSCSIKVNSILSSFRTTDSSDGKVNVDEIKVCAFNGGSDVWVDIGDKSLGVESLQRYLCREMDHPFCPILKSESLHIGDQFASLGANDFKARLSACTVWIASPTETVSILDYLLEKLSN
ncbi:IMP-specific 5'-nucleotidase 1 [[Candida] railenensis]|uniref:IMP-specific 5'-nucleotidase 1 n=1 Tax=[Candida] railenensis TaxID=45579 RepID=A0A9P0VX34_9ASCO|nr:IMP-specific 5'-nucleotidase 1 [[Candida] railenensis]